MIHEAATVERVAVNRLLEIGEELPKSRRDGDTLIIPIFEEVLERIICYKRNSKQKNKTCF